MYLKHIFLGTDPKEYCTTMMLNQLPDGSLSENVEYLLLSDDLPIDFALRTKLHRKRLEAVLTQHQFERTDQTYSRSCLFCHDVLTATNRAAFLDHLYNKHFLNLGRPTNLVYINELIDDVQDKLNQLICLFCSKVFKDRPTLKEHMRKKGHKRINPDNKNYDKYYLINYKRELKNEPSTGGGRHTEYVRAMVSEQSRVFQTPDDSDCDWSDWEGANEPIACLFCAHSELRFASLKLHIQRQHSLNLDAKLADLTFYQKVKVINYIRRQMYTRRCVTCRETFATSEALDTHLNREQHFGIGEKSQWDQPEFFFPTYEDDPMLCHLDDTASTNSTRSTSPQAAEPEDSSVVIIAEEFQSTVNLDAEALSKEFMLSF